MDKNVKKPDFVDFINYDYEARELFYNFIDATKNGMDVAGWCQKIYPIIDDIVLGRYYDQFSDSLYCGKKVYRARIIEPEDDNNSDTGIGKTKDGKYHGYNDVCSREPVIGIAGEGRNNIAGSSYLYVASDPATACVEVKPLLTEYISVAEFEIVKDLKIIDFSKNKSFFVKDYNEYQLNLKVFISLLMLRFSEPVSGVNAYKATQLISDYIRKTGVDGIAYNSFLSPGGVNYTLFNCHPNNVKFCGSKILIHKQAMHSFWDLNEDKAVISNEVRKLMDYDIDIAEKHKNSLNLRLKTID